MSEYEHKKYIHHIQDMMASIVTNYEYAGALRDAATEEEKKIYNNSRGLLNTVYAQCQTLETIVFKEERHDMIL